MEATTSNVLIKIILAIGEKILVVKALYLGMTFGYKSSLQSLNVLIELMLQFLNPPRAYDLPILGISTKSQI